jgi:hypothetical protein
METVANANGDKRGKSMTRISVMALLLLVTACQNNGPPPVPVNDGYAHLYNKGGTLTCGSQPVSFDGSHADVTLEQSCPRVRVTGSHNDLVIYVPPNATIEVTGGHNTIVYRLIRPGARPKWINTGDENELVRNSRAPWERDHDWYKEQH